MIVYLKIYFFSLWEFITDPFITNIKIFSINLAISKKTKINEMRRLATVSVAIKCRGDCFVGLRCQGVSKFPLFSFI